ncbi:CaCA proton/calcium exchanger [Schizosaccharomyces cryophilus OY26]|uniref:Vacuolar calcium ion transporter n=1 Tax=Schizosaccharomyces cryophilus (strain OY26 / ATCC MYA-4695 / CBS 11777 / NBRC 106824 / NRRL Y48691) TaxID=653667 RepID=S9VUG1_SCHCR|nr:CaCA proton/calcium exchanger [Schizosaccharomyces cryophilus OY26]EPY49745.1 CaCA proton/calcium exchanger [Schizosaccharomyces cryophilus OY26]
MIERLKIAKTRLEAMNSFQYSTDRRERLPLLGDERDQSMARHNAIVTTKSVLASSYINFLLVFVPIGLLSGWFQCNAKYVFFLNMLAIVPLSSLLSFATEQLAFVSGPTLGGLLNASFGNAIELIVGVLALRRGETRIVQASLLGSILSNLLLVFGMCLITAGIRHQIARFNVTVAQTMIAMLALSTASIIIPATFHFSLPDNKTSETALLQISRGTAIIVLIVYVLLLVFQLKTHKHVCRDVNESEEDEDHEPVLGLYASIFVLALVTVFVSLCADYLVGSIDALVEEINISKTFVGLIILPVVANAAEHVTAVVVSYRGQMDLALGVAIGSSIQISMFLAPFLVIVGWFISQPLTLYFESLETVILFVSVLLVNYLIQDGASHWLEGVQLLALYAIVVLAFFYYPTQ